MIDMTIVPSLFSGSIYFPFDTILKKHYLVYGIRKNVKTVLIFQIGTSFWEF